MAGKILSAILLFSSVLYLTACSNGGLPSTTAPGSTPKPIDPSGNWTMTATDSGNHSVAFAALFAQTGSVVTANSFTPAGDPSPFACVPFKAALSNGQVQNVNNLTGNVDITNANTGADFGTFSFNTTLNDAGTSFSGTYSNMPPCSGALASGTFTGAEVPTTTGNWTGTVQPCSYDGSTSICTLLGTTSPFTATLSQDDTTGNVTGTYEISGVSGFSSGTISVVPPSDILSGTLWQFTVADVSRNKATVCGGCTLGANGTGLSGLDLNGNFAGILTFNVSGGSNYYWVAASH